MSRLSDLLSTHWFAAVLLVSALLAGGWVFVLRRRRGALSIPLLLITAVLALLGVGGFALPDWWWGLWLTVGAVFTFVVMFFVLVLTGKWWTPLGYAAGALLFFGLGGL